MDDLARQMKDAMAKAQEAMEDLPVQMGEIGNLMASLSAPKETASCLLINTLTVCTCECFAAAARGRRISLDHSISGKLRPPRHHSAGKARRSVLQFSPTDF